MCKNPWKPNHFSSIYKQPKQSAIHKGNKTNVYWTYLLRLESIMRETRRES